MQASEIIQEDATQAVDDDLFEMATLRQNRTGIAGTIYISTQQASHGPRVKYYVARPGKDVPYLAICIEPAPREVENHLPVNVVGNVRADVIEWVRLNHEKLRAFLFEGTAWFDEEVTAFKTGLVKLPSRKAGRNNP